MERQIYDLLYKISVQLDRISDQLDKINRQVKKGGKENGKECGNK